MGLTYRRTEAGDLEECLCVLQQGYSYGGDPQEELPFVWRQLLTAGTLNSTVTEDRERPPGQRILHFGVSVFVTDEFMQAIRAAGAPGVSRRLVEQMRAGQSPILSREAARRANAGAGLNLLILHVGAMGGTDDQIDAVMLRAPESFFWVHGGYYFREILFELRGARARLFSLSGGFHERSDYAAFYRAEGRAAPAPTERQWLLGVTRAEAEQQRGSYISSLFAFDRPRLGLRPGEQSLLEHALRGQTDEEIAHTLAASLSTVKTRWRAIYDRVVDRAPALLPEPAWETGPTEQKRGAEKRRTLLHYLRHHPEELRPFE